ncbi:hypothetical protein [Streptomyces huiliensis]|uniref:hypothetical protein n=1 Tax=Streptomyces huiliensis TaxID=2876027 RepID=UPI001CBE4256|nr:hypothetical protein [Streptomyces huiliensis]MBZ4319403.1 hypothetical protein [Streptomyces huiliensis]
MTVTVSAVVLLLIAAVVALRSRRVGAGAATLFFLLGFFAAGTGADRPIRNLCTAVAHALTNIT